MALLVLCNYILVIFDLTYIPLRDFWLQGRLQITLLRFNEPIKFGTISFQELQIPPDKPLEIPFVKGIAKYDVVKGIKPYRSTSEYLDTVNKLNQIINQKLFNPEFNLGEYRQEIEKILENLRQNSVNMVDNNPFASAEKTGTLEKIKNKMRLRVFKTENVSAKAAFQKFWTWDYLSQNGWEKELKFFNQEIQPLIETNYFRPLGEDGRPIDNFELWRWYDIFLFVPIWRWLRFIPTVIRLDQVKIINLKLIKEQAVKGLVALISKDITEIIVLRIINQIQEYIRRGQVEKFLDRSLNGGYNNLNDTNEVIEIFRLVVNSTVDKVLPQVKPEAEALIKYNIEKILSQTPAYQSLLRLPGMKGLKTDLSNRLSSQLYQSFVNIADKITQEDEVFERLLQQLVQRFGQSLAGELQSRHSLERIEMLLIIFLEEVKLNYVEEFSDEDLETILEQTRLLHSQSAEITPGETMNPRRLP